MFFLSFSSRTEERNTILNVICSLIIEIDIALSSLYVYVGDYVNLLGSHELLCVY